MEYEESHTTHRMEGPPIELGREKELPPPAWSRGWVPLANGLGLDLTGT